MPDRAAQADVCTVHQSLAEPRSYLLPKAQACVPVPAENYCIFLRPVAFFVKTRVGYSGEYYLAPYQQQEKPKKFT